MGQSGKGRWMRSGLGTAAAVVLLAGAAGASTRSAGVPGTGKDSGVLRTPGHEIRLSGMPFVGSAVAGGGGLSESQMLLMYGSAMFGGAALCVAGAARRGRS